MGNRWLGTVAATVLVAMLATGCGGGDGERAELSSARSSTTTTAALVPVPGGEHPAETGTTTDGAAGGSATTSPISASSGPGPTTAAPATTTTTPTTTTTSTTTSTTAPPTTASPTTTAQGATAAITIEGFRFQPAVLQVAVGTTVTATNKDAATHTWSADEGAWESGNLAQGQSYSFRFSQAGTFTYLCKIHPSMRGTVKVG